MGMAQPSGIPQMHGSSGALPQQLLLQQQALQVQQRHGVPPLGAQVSLPFVFGSLKWHTSAPAAGSSLFGLSHSRSRQVTSALLALGHLLCIGTCSRPAATCIIVQGIRRCTGTRL